MHYSVKFKHAIRAFEGFQDSATVYQLGKEHVHALSGVHVLIHACDLTFSKVVTFTEGCLKQILDW